MAFVHVNSSPYGISDSCCLHLYLPPLSFLLPERVLQPHISRLQDINTFVKLLLSEYYSSSGWAVAREPSQSALLSWIVQCVLTKDHLILCSAKGRNECLDVRISFTVGYQSLFVSLKVEEALRVCWRERERRDGSLAGVVEALLMRLTQLPKYRLQ